MHPDQIDTQGSHEAPYERLDVYQKAYQLALELHRLTLGFPKIEQFELASQLRRSSKSIAINIVEGMGRQASATEVVRYIRISMGSCDESRIWLKFAKDLGYVDAAVHTQHCKSLIEIGKMLRGVLQRYESRKSDLNSHVSSKRR
jgi:four helix bundle protein